MITYMSTSVHGSGFPYGGVLIAAVLIIAMCLTYIIKDAEKNNMSGSTWVIIIILLGIFPGIAVYLIARENVKRTEKVQEDFYLRVVEYLNSKEK